MQFSFQKSDDELLLHTNNHHQIPSSNICFQQQATPYQQADLHVVDHLFDHATTTIMDLQANTNNIVLKASSRKRHQSPSNWPSKPNSAANYTDHPVVEDSSKDDHTQRKLAHRETERQRRQDMAKLYASLRSLLPLEFVKGKRSTSDHMHQAVKYIKQMQENIRVLTVKRDQLKKFVKTPSFPKPNSTNEGRLIHTNLLPNTVSVSCSTSSKSCNIRGIQILMNSCLIEDGFPLSRLLKAISEQGLDVISCTCTSVNGRLFHSIQTEMKKTSSNDHDQLANDDTHHDDDLSMLQQRLTALANNCTHDPSNSRNYSS